MPFLCASACYFLAPSDLDIYDKLSYHPSNVNVRWPNSHVLCFLWILSTPHQSPIISMHTSNPAWLPYLNVYVSLPFIRKFFRRIYHILEVFFSNFTNLRYHNYSLCVCKSRPPFHILFHFHVDSANKIT